MASLRACRLVFIIQIIIQILKLNRNIASLPKSCLRIRPILFHQQLSLLSFQPSNWRSNEFNMHFRSKFEQQNTQLHTQMLRKISELQEQQRYIDEISAKDYSNNLMKEDFYELQEENGDMFGRTASQNSFLSLISDPADNSLQFLQDCEFKIRAADKLISMSNRIQLLREQYMAQRESIIESEISESEMITYLQQQEQDSFIEFDKGQEQQLYEAIDLYFAQYAPKVSTTASENNEASSPSTSDECLKKIQQVEVLTQKLRELLDFEN